MRTESLIGRVAIGVTIGCVALVAVTASALAVPAVRSKLSFVFGDSAAYRAGDKVDLPSEFYSASPLTLVIFARSGCGACQQSKPSFVAIVNELRSSSAARVTMATASPQAETEVAYGQSLGLEASAVVATKLDVLRLQVVPTLLLLDREGRVRYASEGVPSAAQQQELLSAVKALQPSG